MSTVTDIRCCHLCKSYGDVPAVCGVDLRVPAGRLVALLGPSGCGKTTVLRMIAGLEQPSRGTIEIGGRMVAGPGIFIPSERRHVGMVFQEYALFPHLDVAANVGFGLAGHAAREQRSAEVLDLVGLREVGHRMPHELSGGQQQRVALARALAPQPAVLLLDEPFSNLDAGMRGRLRSDVRRILRATHMTALFVTHDQEEALSLADRVAIMMEGRILQVDRPEQLYREPATREAATFLGDANVVPGRADGRTAECELGTARLRHPATGRVDLMFRPEDLTLTVDPRGAGRVTEREYFGHDERLTVRLDSGTEFRSRRFGLGSGLHEGTRVSMHLSAPVMAYPRSAAEPPRCRAAGAAGSA